LLYLLLEKLHNMRIRDYFHGKPSGSRFVSYNMASKLVIMKILDMSSQVHYFVAF